MGAWKPWLVASLLSGPLQAAALEVEPHVYVARLTSKGFLLAWGTTGGCDQNTIGRASVPMRGVELWLDGQPQPLANGKNWLEVNNLGPDTPHRYEVRWDRARKESGEIRTLEDSPDRLSFLVVGDWGTGNAAQQEIAEAMARAFQARQGTDRPLRFVLTTGDNIYGSRWLGVFARTKTGACDDDWADKFFRPYAATLRSIPFLPVPGNHDTDESEGRGDWAAYLDNFFVPPPAGAETPTGYYSTRYGDLLELFALDSTRRPSTGTVSWQLEGPQHVWLKDAFAHSKAVWRVPFLHHPLHTAGPEHRPALTGQSDSQTHLDHFESLFKEKGAQVVFTGHEHNFQYHEAEGVAHIVSGAGGALREGPVQRSTPGLRAFASANHFLLVDVDRKEMRIEVLGTSGRVSLLAPDGSAYPQPVIIPSHSPRR